MATYIVKSGDSLSKIGQQAGIAWQDIWKNNTGIKDPNKIYPGQKINIPDKGVQAPAPTLEKTLPPEVKLGEGKTLPQAETSAQPKTDSFASLTIALREASRLAIKQGTGAGLKSAFGGMESAVPGFAPEKVSGGTVSDIIGFVERRVGSPIQDSFADMKDIISGIQRERENLVREEDRIKTNSQSQITQAITNGMWNNMDYEQKKTLWSSAGYVGEPQGVQEEYSSQIILDEYGMGTNLIIDKATGSIVRREPIGKVGKASGVSVDDSEEKEIQDFQEEVAKLIEKMDTQDVLGESKMTWNTAWDILHAKYPQASIETIDNSLGLKRRK